MVRLLLTACLSLAASVAACAVSSQADASDAAITASSGFWSPSRNIACFASSGAAGASLRCDIVKHAWAAPAGSCGARRTAIFSMTSVGTPRPICPNDFVPPRRVVPYGGSWRFAAFRCHVERIGIMCKNGRQRGWFLSRERYELFR